MRVEKALLVMTDSVVHIFPESASVVLQAIEAVNFLESGRVTYL